LFDTPLHILRNCVVTRQQKTDLPDRATRIEGRLRGLPEPGMCKAAHHIFVTCLRGALHARSPAAAFPRAPFNYFATESVLPYLRNRLPPRLTLYDAVRSYFHIKEK
jgi:hypothetical protein